MFSRLQFPINLAFAMTISKAQGQTIERVGLYFPTPVFTHGQLYVALSRVRNQQSIRVILPKPNTIVYKSIYQI
jgi:ATP-dependent exoDNAse (exonuclease V) alpha subunit